MQAIGLGEGVMAILRGLVSATRRRGTAWIVAILMAVAAPGALAAPCAGFTDVEDTSPFCGNVGWLKNRAITLGCTSATLYCPADPVSRLAMAAFMNRLGNALTPVHVPVDAQPGAIDLDISAVVCQSADVAVTGFARRAYVDVAFGASAASDVGVAANLAISSDGGTTWNNLNASPNRGFVRANQWTSFGEVGFADLTVGSSVRFGVRTGRGGLAGAANLTDSRCQLRVLVHNRND
jgi:hypothetical protein